MMPVNAIIDYQRAYQPVQGTTDYVPSLTDLETWVDATLQTEATYLLQRNEQAEITIRIVDTSESQQLNSDYRGKHRPTNVLSFPFEAPEHIVLNLLGDLVICSPVVSSEALEQGKSEVAHWAHMVVHGTLHLLGYDHIDSHDAEKMEQLEVSILSGLGYPNPY